MRYDIEGDGKLDELEKVMQKYDTDQDGTFSMPEVGASRPPAAYG